MCGAAVSNRLTGKWCATISFHSPGDDFGTGFDKFALGFGEGVGEVAFGVELGDYFFLGEDGNDDFGFHHRRTREIARIFGDVVNDDDFTSGGGRTAESLAQGNAGVRRKAAGEWTDDEVIRVGGIDQIKPDPVVARHFLVKFVYAVSHQV